MMADTVDVLVEQYDLLLEYLTAKKVFLEDPSIPALEAIDVETMDPTKAVDTIKRLASSNASIPEAALLMAYRDLHSAEVEISIRNMSRRDYYIDAIDNEYDNIARWTYSKITNSLLMRGTTSQGT